MEQCFISKWKEGELVTQYKQALCMSFIPQTFIHPSKPFDSLPSSWQRGLVTSPCMGANKVCTAVIDAPGG